MDEAQFKSAQVIAQRIMDRHLTGRHGLVAAHALAMVVAQWAHACATSSEEPAIVYLDDLHEKSLNYLGQLQK